MKKGILVLSFLAAMAPAVAMASAPETFTVTKTADTNDGTCDADCSLREAVIAANDNSGFDDTIVLDNLTYTLSIAGTSEESSATGDLDITDNVEITGNGAIIDGADLDRVFDVMASSELDMSDVTVTNGQFGGQGCGINNAGILSISNSTISNNTCTGEGGGIYSSGSLGVTDSVISGNSGFGGGGISTYGPSEIIRTLIESNEGTGHSGGLRCAGGSVAMADSVIRFNSAPDSGGASFNSCPAEISGSTVHNNDADSVVGGVYTSNSDLSIVNSTISGNTGANGSGGIFLSGGTLQIAHTTITGNANTASWSGATGGVFLNSGTVEVKNSIIAENTDTAGTNPDCSAFTGVTGGYNVIGDTTGCSAFDGDATNMLNVDAGLSALADNGGMTETHEIATDSPAFDLVPNAFCTDTDDASLTLDQRGETRPANDACDAGSYEQQSPYVPPVPEVLTFVSAVGLPNNQVEVFYDDGSSAIFTVFASGPGTPKVRITEDGENFLALKANGKVLRVFDPYTGAKLDGIKLRMNNQDVAKFKVFNFYDDGREEIIFSTKLHGNVRTSGITLTSGNNLTNKNTELKEDVKSDDFKIERENNRIRIQRRPSFESIVEYHVDETAQLSEK